MICVETIGKIRRWHRVDKLSISKIARRLVFHLMGSLAEFERALITERTKAGIAAARKRGVKLGRKPAHSPAQIDHARMLIDKGESPSVVARTLQVGRSTLYRSVQIK